MYSRRALSRGRSLPMFAALAGTLRRAEAALARPCAQWVREMATKKSGGSGGRTLNRNPKYLGMKVRGDALVKEGGIIMRQRGHKFVPGENAAMGRDHTVYALVPGYVSSTSSSTLRRPTTT